MTQHYFSEKPVAESRPQKLEAVLRLKKFTFTTDAGVFSKKEIDFGSLLLIENMQIAADARVLDVGCGYGPIGLSAAAIVPQGTVTMLDINERAVELAKQNAKNNGIVNVRILQSDTLQAVLGESFDCVLTNPPIRAGKEVVHRIFEEAHEVLMKGGSLWVVIRKKQGSPSAFRKLEQLFESVEEVAKDKGYRIFKATN